MRILNKEPAKEVPDKARAVIIDNMGRVAITDYAGCLMFPGGKLDTNESSDKAVKREVMEELGIKLPEGEKLFTFQLEAENYPERDGTLSGKRLVETDYYEFRIPTIEESDHQLTESERIGNLTLRVVALDELLEIVENHETENDRWPYFKQEMTIVADYLLEQENNE